MLLALIGLISIAAAEKHYEIVLADDHDVVLVMTDNEVGFQNKENIPRDDSKRAHILMEKGSIKIGDQFICKSQENNHADLCVTSEAIGGKFELLFVDNHSVMMQDRHLALGKGPWNGNADMFTAVISDVRDMDVKDYHLDVLEYQDDTLIGINPKTRPGTK